MKKMIISGIVVATFFVGCAFGRYIPDAKLGGAEEIFASATDTFDGTEISEENTENAIHMEEAVEETEEPLTEEELFAQEVKAFQDAIPKVTLTKPVNYSYEKALQILEEYALTDDRFEKIIDTPEKYPEKLLINLANMPEMIAFVENYDGIETDCENAVLTDEELEQYCPLFLQWDARWGAHAYGDGNMIAVAGCGPTSLSMVVVGLTGDAEVTPTAVADYAMEHGYYLSGTGTKWELMSKGAKAYGLDSKQIRMNESQMKQALDDGAYLICSVRKGDFTTGGHFIVIYGYDEQGFFVNDPQTVYRSNIQWTFDSLRSQMKAVWALKKEL